MDNYKYDVALSFASEQREYVEQVANQLSILGISFFYDNHDKINLWGKNLIKYLEKVYYQDSRYCVMFISRDYKDKCWTKYESECIQERIFLQNENDDFQQYILPVKFDDTKIPGVQESLGYIQAQETSPIELARMICDKIKNIHSISDKTLYVLTLEDMYSELEKKLPKDFIVRNIKKSISKQKMDAILLFDDSCCFQNNFSYCDAKIFFDSNNSLNVLNLGYFEEPEIIFESTFPKIADMIYYKAKKSNYKID